MKINDRAMPLVANPQIRKAEMEEKMHGAAKLYEQHFLDEMVKAMRSTIHKDEGFIKPNMAENIFSEKLDQQYVEGWANKGGIGLADMIYKQIHEMVFPNDGLAKPKGPLPLNKMATPLQLQTSKKSDQHAQFLFRTGPTPPLVQMEKVQSPWDGRVLSRQQDGDWNYLTLDHGNGLQSDLAFQGQSSPPQVGQAIAAGETLGWLGRDGANLRWDVRRV